MRKEEKKEKQFPGKTLISGAFVFFTTYIIGIILNAWLISKKLISQDAVHSVLTVMCLVGSFFSCWISCRKIKWGTLVTALLTTGVIALVILTVGNCFPSGIVWSKENCSNLVCILVGSITASVLTAKKPRKWKRIIRKRVS